MKNLAWHLLFNLLLPTLIFAHEGDSHDQSPPPIVANGIAPQRLPDGRIFLPKPTQRFIQVRTWPAKPEALPRSLILNGEVVAGIEAYRKVQALQAGRLNMANHRLFSMGERIIKGQIIGTIDLAKNAQEGTNQAAEAASLKEQLKLAELDYQRLQKLGNVIAQREVEAAAVTVSRLQAQLAVFNKGTRSITETIYSPMTGIITGNYAADGQAVQAGDLLLEIIDPSKLQIEAITYDTTLPAHIAAASITLGQQTYALRYQGQNPQLRQQALRLRFSIDSATAEGLAAGLRVQVMVQTRETLSGIAIPAAAITRNSSNQPIVWVKIAPEYYAPRAIQYQPLDGQQVLITAGLQDGERVVIQGTPLINQIR